MRKAGGFWRVSGEADERSRVIASALPDRYFRFNDEGVAGGAKRTQKPCVKQLSGRDQKRDLLISVTSTPDYQAFKFEKLTLRKRLQKHE